MDNKELHRFMSHKELMEYLATDEGQAMIQQARKAMEDSMESERIRRAEREMSFRDSWELMNTPLI
jgi:hypothetical protein